MLQMESSELCQGLDFLTAKNVLSGLTMDDLDTMTRAADNVIGVQFRDTYLLSSTKKTVKTHFHDSNTFTFFNNSCPTTMNVIS